MTEVFVVRGELAAWALGLEEDDVLTPEEVAEFNALHKPAPQPHRRKRRLGHEAYRQLPPMLHRREPIGR